MEHKWLSTNLYPPESSSYMLGGGIAPARSTVQEYSTVVVLVCQRRVIFSLMSSIQVRLVTPIPLRYFNVLECIKNLADLSSCLVTD